MNVKNYLLEITNCENAYDDLLRPAAGDHKKPALLPYL